MKSNFQPKLTRRGTKLKCLRCHYGKDGTWFQRGKWPPKNCSACKSRLWNIPRILLWPLSMYAHKRRLRPDHPAEIAKRDIHKTVVDK